MVLTALSSAPLLDSEAPVAPEPQSAPQATLPRVVQPRRYVRQPVPLRFPTEERVPESPLHLDARILLLDSVSFAFEARALVCSDQFLYWDPTDSKKCLAPDFGVRIGPPGPPLEAWKTWERGAPQVGVEMVDDPEAPPGFDEKKIEAWRELKSWRTWEQGTPQVGVELQSDSDSTPKALLRKLERYRQAGIAEVVWFDAKNTTRPIRLWDLLDGDLVERVLDEPAAFHCDALGLYWCIQEHSKLGRVLRLAYDPEGQRLLPTRLEAEHAARKAERAAKEAERAAKEAERAAKEQALARVAELEALLGKKP